MSIQTMCGPDPCLLFLKVIREPIIAGNVFEAPLKQQMIRMIAAHAVGTEWRCFLGFPGTVTRFRIKLALHILSDDRHIIGKPNDCQQQCHTFENIYNIIYIYVCIQYIYIYVYHIHTLFRNNIRISLAHKPGHGNPHDSMESSMGNNQTFKVDKKKVNWKFNSDLVAEPKTMVCFLGVG